MEKFTDEHLQQLFAGTWISLALLAEALVHVGFLTTDEVTESLSFAEAQMGDHREDPLREIRRLLERFEAAKGDIRPGLCFGRSS